MTGVRELGNPQGNALAKPRQQVTSVVTPPQVTRQFQYGNYPGAPTTYYAVTPLYPLPNGDIFVDYASNFTYGLNPVTGALTPHAALGAGTHRKAYDGTLLLSVSGSFTEHTYGQLTSKRYAITGYSHWAKLTNGDSIFANTSNNNLVRVNSSGVVQWTRTLSSNTNTTVAISGLRETPDGGVYVFGYTTGTYFVTNTSTYRAFIAEFDTSGTLLNSVTISTGDTNNLTPKAPTIGANGVLYLPLQRGSGRLMQEINAGNLTLAGSSFVFLNSNDPQFSEGSPTVTFTEDGGVMYTRNTTGYQISQRRFSNLAAVNVNNQVFKVFNGNIYLYASADTSSWTSSTGRPTFTVVENVRNSGEFFWSGSRSGGYGFAGAVWGISDSSNLALSAVSATYTLTNTTAATCTFTTPTLTQSQAGPTLVQTIVTTS